MTVPTHLREFLNVELDLIDDPALPSRSSMNDEKLEDLAASVRTIGLQQPIIVARVGERFEVIAGHRRRLACLRAGLTTVPCIVYPNKSVDLLTIQAHENTRREELNPADEGIWFAELLARSCGDDIEKLAGLVGETVNYIDGRLALVRGDPRVFDALRAGQIKIGVAHELNKVESDHFRNYFLQCAVQSGATVGAVTGWILQWRRDTQAPSAPAAAGEPTAPGIAAELHNPFTCRVCKRGDNVHLMRQINVHVHCDMAILRPLLGETEDGATT